MSRADEAAGDRKSRAASPVLITDPEERARREVDNGLRQFDAVLAMVEQYRDEKRDFKLRLSTILTLHRIALDGIGRFAGNFRPAGVEIGGSKHEPVGAHAAWKENQLDVSQLGQLLGDYLSAQLVGVIEQASGSPIR